jgi:tRNA-binding EMAP/Myf-like protein
MYRPGDLVASNTSLRDYEVVEVLPHPDWDHLLFVKEVDVCNETDHFTGYETIVHLSDVQPFGAFYSRMH